MLAHMLASFFLDFLGSSAGAAALHSEGGRGSSRTAGVKPGGVGRGEGETDLAALRLEGTATFGLGRTGEAGAAATP